ncbi:bifunctional folylpolyglutamate synthase/dihydrofolate synthase, partial [bacterium]|nr:bifunctional folylpolyglutamate synthase/dihydrofolate synthase [bacterium]
MQAAYEQLGMPANDYKTIHVTGTNGKGSVSLNIARGIEKNGFKVGLFISPHIHCLTERISINRIDIFYSRIEQIFQENKEILSKFCFFDLLTLIALI